MKISTCIFALSGALLLTGGAARPPEDELRLTRERLEKFLVNYAESQQQMTILSSQMFALAQMERDWIEFRIWNQPGYDKIEKAYMRDRVEWERKAEDEAKKPSPYEGGTLAPCERNLQMVDFEKNESMSSK